VIDDLDESLKALLRRELPPAISEQVSVSFAAPDDEFHSSVKLPAVDLFLYDIRENLELRSNDEYLQRAPDGTALRTRSPVRVDASYLITAWPGSSEKDRPEDEHRLLGEVMQALLRSRTLPRSVLKGSIAQQELPLPVSTLQPGRLQSLGEFWQALGGKPKAALNYTVTFSVDVGRPEPVTLVTDKIIRIDVGVEELP
jgi:Pvc16 N-terminal domain